MRSRKSTSFLVLLIAIIAQLMLALIQDDDGLAVYADAPFNHLQNPGFEQLADGNPVSWLARSGWTNPLIGASSAAARTGGGGVWLHNTQETDRSSVSQALAVDEFATFTFSFWLKSVDVTGMGVGIRVEFYSEEPMTSNTFLSVSRGAVLTLPAGVWRQAEHTVKVPAEAKYAAVYVMNYGTGTVHVDDAAAIETIPQPIILSSEPNQLTYYPDVAAATIKTELYPKGGSHAGRTVDFKVAHAVTGAVLASQSGYAAQDHLQFQFDPQTMQLREPYAVSTVVRDTYANVVDSSETVVYRWERPTSVLADGTLLVDGQPFFPVIAYHAYMTDYPHMAEIGVNTVIGSLTNSAATVQRVLDEAHEHGLKMLYPLYYDGKMRENFELIETLVPAFKDHPALIGWMLMDEPSSVNMSVEELAETYRLIRSLDPVHPVYEVEAAPEQFGNYGRVPDVLAIDTYPFPRKPITAVGEETRQAYAATGQVKPVWHILQTFHYPESTSWPYLPNSTEVRNMAYQALTGGAKGYGYYSINDPGWRLRHSVLWNGLKSFKDELALIAKLSRAQSIAGEWGDGEEWKLWETDEGVYAVILNETATPTTAVLPLEWTGYTAELLHGRAREEFRSASDELVVELDALDTLVYRLQPFYAAASSAAASAEQSQPWVNDPVWTEGMDDLAEAMSMLSTAMMTPGASMQIQADSAVSAVSGIDDLTAWVSGQTNGTLNGNKAMMLERLAELRAVPETIAAALLDVTAEFQPPELIAGELSGASVQLYNGLASAVEQVEVELVFPASFGMPPANAAASIVTAGTQAVLAPSFTAPVSLPEVEYPLTVKTTFRYNGVELAAERLLSPFLLSPVAVELPAPVIEVKQAGAYPFEVKLTNRLNRAQTAELSVTAGSGFTAQLPAAVALDPLETKVVQGLLTVSATVTDGTYGVSIVPRLGGADYEAAQQQVIFNANLLINPGIEEANVNGKTPESWYLKNGFWDASESHSGVYAIRLDPEPSNSFHVTYTAGVAAEAGKPYRLSAWIKNSATAGTVSIGARFINSSGATISYAWKDLPPASGWTQADLSVVTPPGTAGIALYVKVDQQINGSVWIDDGYVTPLPLSVQLTPSTLYANRAGEYPFTLQLVNVRNMPATVEWDITTPAGITVNVPAPVALLPLETRTVTGTVYRSASVTEGVYGISVQPIVDSERLPALDLTVSVGQNPVSNPGLETANGSGTAPLGWSLKAGVWDSSETHSGSRAGRLDPDAANIFNVLYSDRIAAGPGESLTVKAYVKTGLTAGRATLGIRYINAGGSSIAYAWHDVPLASDWSQQQLTVTTPPGTAGVAVYLQLDQQANGSVWMDDVKLYWND